MIRGEYEITTDKKKYSEPTKDDLLIYIAELENLLCFRCSQLAQKDKEIEALKDKEEDKWHYVRTEDDLPRPRNDRKVLTWYGRNTEEAEPVILDADIFDVGGGVIAWKEITPPKE